MVTCNLQMVLAVAVAAAVQLSPTVLAAAGCNDVGERHVYQYKTKRMPPEFMSFLTDGFNPLNGRNAHKGCSAASVYWQVIQENHRIDREMYACGRWLVDTETGQRISEYELADRHGKDREFFNNQKKFNCEQAQKYADGQREAAARAVKEAAEAAARSASEGERGQPRGERCASPKKINRNDGTHCLVVSNPCDETVSIGAYKFEKVSGKRLNYSAQVEGGGKTEWCQDNPDAPAYEYYGFCYPKDVAAGKCRTKPYGQ